jgi:Zn-dependent oligopeptidase
MVQKPITLQKFQESVVNGLLNKGKEDIV